MGRPFAVLLAGCFLLGQGNAALAQEVDFQRDIRPLLASRCFKCHGLAAHKGKLRLDLRDWATKRQAIVPGRPEASKLLARVQAADEDERMPPPAAGDRLKPAQIALLKAWIARGAEYSPHWAFVAPQRPALPRVMDPAWGRNPIDRFILARLEKEGLRPAPEADRPTLIRRLSLDLLGLLPSPQEVADFVNDRQPGAYERLVERLLASPHYGERQARHWLDLARYADSNGYTIDGKRSIWPWRDWVIAAFNADMPFDRFTTLQLAGDLLGQPSRDQLVATGFHRNTSFNEEGGTNPEQFRVERTVDRTNTTGTVWLGLTVGCAQCHDHKYDPISQKEYYQLYAFFNSTNEPELPLPTAKQAQKLKELNAELARAKSAPAPRPKSREELAKLVGELEKETNGGWRVIYPKAIMSEQGATFTALEDRSVLAGGKVGPSDTYVVQGVAPETGTVTAVRLEALTHPSLPQRGPGRASNGNFVLSQLVFETDGVPHPFRKAIADHSQAGYDVSDALRGDPHKGWAVNAGDPKERNVDREAVFYLKRPHLVREGQAFVFTLRFSQVPASYPLGRFRIAITFASPRFLELPLGAQQIVLTDRRQRRPADMERLQKALSRNAALSEQVARLRKEIQALQGRLDSTLILRATDRPRPTHILKRGDFLAPGEAVEPGTLAVLPPVQRAAGFIPAVASPAAATPTRLDLARWLVSPQNPLTDRVVVNRIWQQYFGKGLVETENDFGTQGSPPTHPELLDWLATEFVRQGWGVKAMHRLIVTSAVYRQASRERPELRQKDPGNRLLGRQHRLRLEAEIIRDAALSASGLLSRKLGGPGVYPPQPPEIFAFTQNNHPWPESKGPDRYRRGLYTFIWRQSQHPLLATFDAPDAQAACTRRNRSDTPLQALHLANDPTFMEIARALAGRVLREGPSDDAGRVEYAFQLCFSRQPSPAERSRLLAYLEQQRQADPGQAWALVARVLLNLDEFITRE
jgi:mono/diheme cytochrome c family protein